MLNFLSIDIEKVLKWVGEILPIFSFLLFPFTGISQESITIILKINDDCDWETLIVDDSIHYDLTTNVPKQITISSSENSSFSFTNKFESSLILRVRKDSTIHCECLNTHLKLGEVTIHNKIFENSFGGILRLSKKEMESLPMVMGESEVLRALSILPGVGSGYETTSGLYIRGGSDDQNLYLQDGNIILNPYHFLGFSSVYNPAIVNQVKLYTGYIPAQFGGRASAVIEVLSKPNFAAKTTGEAHLGTITSGIGLTGPLLSNKLYHQSALRLMNLGVYAIPAYFAYKGHKKNSYRSYWYYDFNEILTYRINKNSMLSAKVYLGGDLLPIWERGIGEEIRNTVKWGNQNLSLDYQYDFGHTRHFQVKLSRSHGDFQFNNLLQNLQEDTISHVAFQNSNTVYNLKSRYNFRINHFHNQIGIDLSRQYLNFQKNDVNLYERMGFPAHQNELALYGETEHRINENWDYTAGTRAVLLSSPAYASRIFLEPRLKVRYHPSSLAHRFHAGYSHIHQFVHITSSSSLAKIHYPCTDYLQPNVTHIFVIGYENASLNNLKLIVEPYFKQTLNNTYQNRNISLNLYRQASDFFLNNGLTRSYGIDLLAEWTNKRNSFIASYSWLASLTRFDGLNEGEWFPTSFSRPHQLNVVFSQWLSHKWKFISSFNLASGYPVTVPTGVVKLQDGAAYYVFNEPNNTRLDSYDRLDIGVEKNYSTKNGRKAIWSFGVYNVYNSGNPVYPQFDLWQNGYSETGKILSDDEVILESRVYSLSAVPFLPYIKWKIEF